MKFLKVPKLLSRQLLNKKVVKWIPLGLLLQLPLGIKNFKISKRLPEKRFLKV